LTITLVLVAIIAVVAIAHRTPYDTDAIADGETLKGILRNTRTRALSDIVPWSLQVAGQTGTVQRNGVTQNTMTVTFATGGVAAGTTTFDNRGQPSGTLSYSVTNYPFSPVTVTTGTGFVP
jgi:Tfp pilus assembly protein FimT